jgi:hypothetical protein
MPFVLDSCDRFANRLEYLVDSSMYTGTTPSNKCSIGTVYGWSLRFILAGRFQLFFIYLLESSNGLPGSLKTVDCCCKNQS